MIVIQGIYRIGNVKNHVRFLPVLFFIYLMESTLVSSSALMKLGPAE